MRIETIAMLVLCGGMIVWAILAGGISAIMLRIALIIWITTAACFVCISDRWHYWYLECKKREEERLQKGDKK